MAGKCFATVRSRKCKSVVLFTDLVSTSWKNGWSENKGQVYENGQAIYLVDTADLETKRAAFNTRSVHVIPNK
jgi:hypothetical protein